MALATMGQGLLYYPENARILARLQQSRGARLLPDRLATFRASAGVSNPLTKRSFRCRTVSAATLALPGE
jgi:hypothetical protein